MVALEQQSILPREPCRYIDQGTGGAVALRYSAFVEGQVHLEERGFRAAAAVMLVW